MVMMMMLMMTMVVMMIMIMVKVVVMMMIMFCVGYGGYVDKDDDYGGGCGDDFGGAGVTNKHVF